MELLQERVSQDQLSRGLKRARGDFQDTREEEPAAEGSEISFKVLCTDDDCGKFLGHKGENKRREEERLKVDIKVSRREQRSAKHDLGVRCISVSSSGNRVGELEAVLSICTLVAERNSDPHRPNSALVRLLFSQEQLSAITRAGGTTILQLQQTGAAVSQHPAEMIPIGNSNEDVVQIQGELAQVRAAVQLCAETAWDSGSKMLEVKQLPADIPPKLFSMQAYAHAAVPPAPPPAESLQRVLAALSRQPVLLPLTFSQPSAGMCLLQQQLAHPLYQGLTAPSTLPSQRGVAPPGEARVRLIISQAQASFLMAGQPGCAVCRLQSLRDTAKLSNCRLQLHDNKLPGNKKHPLRCLEIVSGFDAGQGLPAVWTYLKEIVMLLLGSLPADTSAAITLVLPDDGQAGAVIGHNGSIIASMRQETGAHIRVFRDLSAVAATCGEILPQGVTAEDQYLKIEGGQGHVMSGLCSTVLKLIPHQEKVARTRLPAISPDSTPRGSPIVRGVASTPQGSPLLPQQDTDRAAKRTRTALQPSDYEVFLSILITPLQKEVVMGHKGSNMKMLRVKYPSAFLKLHDDPRPDTLRKLDIGGTRDEVRRVKNCINYTLAEAGLDDLPPGQQETPQP